MLNCCGESGVEWLRRRGILNRHMFEQAFLNLNARLVELAYKREALSSHGIFRVHFAEFHKDLARRYGQRKGIGKVEIGIHRIPPSSFLLHGVTRNYEPSC